jgi:hypothetical protein
VLNQSVFRLCGRLRRLFHRRFDLYLWSLHFRQDPSPRFFQQSLVVGIARQILLGMLIVCHGRLFERFCSCGVLLAGIVAERLSRNWIGRFAHGVSFMFRQHARIGERGNGGEDHHGDTKPDEGKRVHVVLLSAG